MNLHAIVNPIITAVNPNLTGALYTSSGYSTAGDGTQIPAYTLTPDVPMQFQALSAKDLEHLDSLNIQGLMRAVYLYGDVQGVQRLLSKGGDVLYVNGIWWLVTQVLETWDAAGWCKVAVTQQKDPPPGLP